MPAAFPVFVGVLCAPAVKKTTTTLWEKNWPSTKTIEYTRHVTRTFV